MDETRRLERPVMYAVSGLYELILLDFYDITYPRTPESLRLREILSRRNVWFVKSLSD